MRDDVFMNLMKVLPKSALSAAVGNATRLKAPSALHQAAMRAFAARYGVDMGEAEHDFSGYSTFGDFFTRRLKPGMRTVVADPHAVASPVDGAVSQVGYAEDGQLLQAKGISYPLAKLIGDAEAAQDFVGGAYVTLYLSPRDYHRIHSPLTGEIEGYSYIPGEFWPVNPASVRSKEALFCVNERLVTFLRTDAGRLAVVKVGATCVSRIRASYDDVVTHQKQRKRLERYPLRKPVEKGGELGVFEMGSTVILLFEPNRVVWESWLVQEAKVRMGQKIGVWK